MNKIKTFILPVEEMTIGIMRDCLNVSNPDVSFSDDYIEKVILNTRRNKGNTKMVIFYRGVKPDSCMGYSDVNWSEELQKDEWNNTEEL